MTALDQLLATADDQRRQGDAVRRLGNLLLAAHHYREAAAALSLAAKEAEQAYWGRRTGEEPARC